MWTQNIGTPRKQLPHITRGKLQQKLAQCAFFLNAAQEMDEKGPKPAYIDSSKTLIRLTV